MQSKKITLKIILILMVVALCLAYLQYKAHTTIGNWTAIYLLIVGYVFWLARCALKREGNEINIKNTQHKEEVKGEWISRN